MVVNNGEPTDVYPLSLHDALPISAVSTLSLRARAGFRSAWLQAHVRAGSAPSECRSVVTKLGDYQDRKSTRLNSSHVAISYAVFCLKKKKILCNDKSEHIKEITAR